VRDAAWTAGFRARALPALGKGRHRIRLLRTAASFRDQAEEDPRDDCLGLKLFPNFVQLARAAARYLPTGETLVVWRWRELAVLVKVVLIGDEAHLFLLGGGPVAECRCRRHNES
jgi:hypothetical protein